MLNEKILILVLLSKFSEMWEGFVKCSEKAAFSVFMAKRELEELYSVKDVDFPVYVPL